MKNPFKKYKSEIELEEKLRDKQNKKERKKYLNPNAKAFVHKFLKMVR